MDVTRTTRTPAFWGYPRRPMITHTIDQVILNPKSILLTSSYRIPSQNMVMAEKLEKLAQNLKFLKLCYKLNMRHTLWWLWLFVANIEIIDLGLKTLQSGHIFKVKVGWPWRYRSWSKVITCDTPSHASDHLYQIWNESIQNCRRYRADTIFKVKAEWPWK